MTYIICALLIAGAFYLQYRVQPQKLQPIQPKLVQKAVQPTATTTVATTTKIILPPPVTLGPDAFLYGEIVDSCGPYFTGACVNVRTGPGTNYPVAMRLRTGVLLKITESTTTDGQIWYKLDPGSDIRYPERVKSDWYIQSDFVRTFYHTGDEKLTGAASTTSKYIIVSISRQLLSAYDGNALFLQDSVSTGLFSTPTPLGTYHIYRKTPSRYMQGPLPGISGQYYDLPGVPWDLYFTVDGAAIHGTYWHNHFGELWSHGCVNLPFDSAEKLYDWAPLGTTVYVVS